MEDVVNPALPSTTGALLAEEWTINPFATLPSFLEMFMIDEASRSARKSLDAGIGILQKKLAAQSRLTLDNERQTSNSTSLSISSTAAFLRRWAARAGSFVSRLMEKFGPELACLILYALERHCLRSDASATISESLYGGKQAKLGSHSGDKKRHLLPLTDKDKTRLALVVAIGPYLRRRLLLLYQKLQRGPASPHTTTNVSMLEKLKKVFVWIYPMIHVSISSLDLVYQWRYMLGQSVFFRPSAQILGLVLRRVTQEDTLESQPKHDNPANGMSSTPNDPGGSKLRDLAVLALSSAVILSWVSHFRAEFRRQRDELLTQQQQQQQQTGNTNQTAANLHSSTLTPPAPANPFENSLPPHLCPLCRQLRVHPTASSSGYVFCYKCLLQHVKENGSCPVTGRTCKEAQLLRLYEPNHATS